LMFCRCLDDRLREVHEMGHHWTPRVTWRWDDAWGGLPPGGHCLGLGTTWDGRKPINNGMG
jgi:hypothetical protein